MSGGILIAIRIAIIAIIAIIITILAIIIGWIPEQDRPGVEPRDVPNS